MIIAVSMREVTNNTYPEVRDSISHDWVRTLDALAITAVFVPNALRNPAAYLRAVGARGLILTGGDNLGQLPDEPSESTPPSERDRTEIALLNCAFDHRLPVLGVCRGLQLVNVYFGGGLVRDLSSFGQHVNVLHKLEIAPPPHLVGQYVDEVVTNSFHSQGVCLSGLAPDLKAFAIASDDVVEGLYHPSLPVLAVQWHPERQNPASELDQALLKDWIARCE